MIFLLSIKFSLRMLLVGLYCRVAILLASIVTRLGRLLAKCAQRGIFSSAFFKFFNTVSFFSVYFHFVFSFKKCPLRLDFSEILNSTLQCFVLLRGMTTILHSTL